MKRSPGAVIFDMDGLLLDTERVALEVYLAVSGQLDIRRATAELYDTLIGRNWRTTQRLLHDALGKADADRLIGAWKKEFEARVADGGIPKKHGVDDVLEFLGRHGIPRALATSTSRPLTLRQLDTAGLTRHFPVVATGDEVENGKPSPDIFLLAAARLGVAPSKCLVLEDSGPGVEAASRAGMRVIMVPDLVHPTPRILSWTERVCSDLTEVRAWLDAALFSPE